MIQKGIDQRMMRWKLGMEGVSFFLLGWVHDDGGKQERIFHFGA